MEVTHAFLSGKEIAVGTKYRIKADRYSWQEGCPRWADGHLVVAEKINRCSVKVRYLDEIDPKGNPLVGSIAAKYLFPLE